MNANSVAILVSLIVGASGILQGSMNRSAAQAFGLAGATLFNNLICAVASAAILGLVLIRPDWFPTLFHAPQTPAWSEFRLWMAIPGLFGLTIVLGLPWSFVTQGALATTLFVLVGQMLTSVVVDYYMDGAIISAQSFLGLALVGVGVALFQSAR